MSKDVRGRTRNLHDLRWPSPDRLLAGPCFHVPAQASRCARETRRSPCSLPSTLSSRLSKRKRVGPEPARARSCDRFVRWCEAPGSTEVTRVAACPVQSTLALAKPHRRIGVAARGCSPRLPKHVAALGSWLSKRCTNAPPRRDLDASNRRFATYLFVFQRRTPAFRCGVLSRRPARTPRSRSATPRADPCWSSVRSSSPLSGPRERGDQPSSSFAVS